MHARCVIRGHDIPKNLAFESCAAVFAGGICAECGELQQEEFLGNTWTKETEVESKGKETSITVWFEGFDISFATEKGYVVFPLDWLQSVSRAEKLKEFYKRVRNKEVGNFPKKGR